MKKLALLISLLLLPGCVSSKPFFFCAKPQADALPVTMTVLYDGFREAEVRDAFDAAVIEFAMRTRIVVSVVEYRPIHWASLDYEDMIGQVRQLYPDGAIPTRWVFMVYRRTPLEWALLLFVPMPLAAAEPGGHWAVTSVLWQNVLVHEMYHLGWEIEERP